MLDFANLSTGQPRILAFDLSTNELVHRCDFPIRTKDLNDESLIPEALAAKVEDFGPKTLSSPGRLGFPDTEPDLLYCNPVDGMRAEIAKGGLRRLWMD